MPVVSVIMAIHRDQPHLRPAILSILKQTWTDLELVLVDNGTGLTAAALGAAGSDPRVRWVRRPRNDGIGPATNEGVQAARGEFIAIMDHDDLALPDRLAREVAALRADPQLGLVSGFADRIDAEDRPVRGRVFTLADPRDFLAYSQYAAPVIHPAMMARRTVFEDLPFRAEFPYASELDFYARVTERWRLAVIPEVLLRYRVHAAQTTSQHAASIEQSRCTINLRTARRRAGRPEAPGSTPPLVPSVSAAEFCRRTAAQCLREGYALPAAYLARRSFALERTPGSALQATRLGGQAWRAAVPGQRGQVASMFLTGPVKTLGLAPA